MLSLGGGALDVTGLYVWILIAFLGGLLAGFLASLAGAGPTLIGEGVVLLGFVVFLMARRERLIAGVARSKEA